MAEQFKIRVRHGDIAGVRGSAVAVGLYKGAAVPEGAAASVDAASGGCVGAVLGSGDFKGKRGEALAIYPGGESPWERVLLLGLGERESFDADAARDVGGALAGLLRRINVEDAVCALPGEGSGTPADRLSRGLVEGVALGLYRYHAYFRDGRAEPLVLETLTLVEKNRGRIRAVERGTALGLDVAESMNFTRDLVNGPGNLVTPTYLANQAKALGKEYGFKVTVMSRVQCEKLGMGAFLAVAQGSAEPCKFIVMDYRGGSRGTVCLVGKGITFDTGGISLKPGAEMDLMKYDMGGSGAVLGAMRFAAARKVPLRVVGVIASTENMPGGRAYKPGDILTASNGVTIEVKNTDAEGRLVLADALVHAAKFEPDAVVDLATLTGACVIALGAATAAMGNDEWLLDAVKHAADGAGERVWPMPLWREYREKVKSKVADIRNSAGREAGTLTAGAFLGAFTDPYRWVHLDIAGAAWNDKAASGMTQGAAAGGVRTLCQFLTDWKRPKGKNRAPKPGPRTSLRGITPTPGPMASGKTGKRS